MCRGATGNGLMSTGQPFGIPSGMWSQTTFDSTTSLPGAIPVQLNTKVEKTKTLAAPSYRKVKLEKETPVSSFPSLPSQDLEFDFSPFTFTAEDVISTNRTAAASSSSIGKLPSLSEPSFTPTAYLNPVTSSTDADATAKSSTNNTGLSGTKRKFSFDDLDFLISDLPDDVGLGSDTEFSYSSGGENSDDASYSYLQPSSQVYDSSPSTPSSDSDANAEEYLDALLLDCLGDGLSADSAMSSTSRLDMSEDLDTHLLGTSPTPSPVPAPNACISTPVSKVVTPVLRPGNGGDASCSSQGVGVRSKYKGVRWYKRTNKWVVQIRINGSRKHVGYFADEEEAGKAYAAAMQEAKLTMGKEKKGNDGRRRKRSKQ